MPTAPSTPRSFVRSLLGDPGWTVAFPRVERPDVSIVMLTLNKVEYTYDSLESLLARADVPYELIVVDNGSTDETLDLLSRLQNVTVLRNDSNRGFGPACNQGAARARGEHLLFLNNDAELAPGCLSALLRTAQAEPRCGAVGGRLVWPDGRLQEAGSILWDDGTAEACGRGGDPNAPEVSYLREVDFCSGALLLVRRELFEKLGRFDERFAPIYYEDVDLCVGLRGLGFRVLYQPAAVARHQEYGTTSAKATELMQRNHARFVEKRQGDLVRQPSRSAGVLRARERVERPRLLVIDDRVPTSDAGSGYPRSHALLHLLRRHEYPVTFFPGYDPTPHQPWLRELQQKGVEMVCDGRPFAEFAAERAGLYDVVLVSRPHNFSTVRADLTRCFPRAVVIYDAEALFFVRDEAKAAVGEPAALQELAEKQQRELDLLRFAHLVVAVSEREKRLLERAAPHFQGQVAVWGHPVEVQPTPRPFAERRDLLFVGSFFAPRSPNVDALSFFVRDVLPLVHRRLDCRLEVVGYGAQEAVGDRASDRVQVTGYAPDLDPFYDSRRVFVVPSRYSAGIPLKLCEAMARGLPSVVTELTALQLGVEHGREVLVGRTPDELAEQVVRLYTDESLWNHVRANALEFVRRHHDPETLGRALDDIIGGALAAGPTGTD
jgi:GT2 family glycosyltransferase